MRTIYTIGYEGSTIGDFVEKLKRRRIEILIDIRELPLSRKPGFSKRSLEAALEQEGIAYVHFKDLGDPKPGRDAARRGDLKRFREIFSSHLEKAHAQEALSRAVEIAKDRRSCLLCFERDHTNCHRSIVAKEMEDKHRIAVQNI